MSRIAPIAAVAVGSLPLLWMLASLYPQQQAAWEASRRGAAFRERVLALERTGQRSAALALLDERLEEARADGAADAPTADDPETLELHFTRAVLWMRAGERRRAREALEALARAAPEHAATHNALGALAERRRDWSEAAERYARACRLAPDVAEYAANRGLLALRRGDRALARSSLEAARRLGSRRPAVERALARLGDAAS